MCPMAEMDAVEAVVVEWHGLGIALDPFHLDVRGRSALAGDLEQTR